MRAIALVLVFALVLLSTAALAEVPGLMNYQGILTDGDGVALDTTVSMTFTIYTDSTGGTQVWTETQPAVVVSSGIFNVLLGRVNGIPDTVFKDPERWLGVQVGGDPELTSRQRIAAVGYAFRAAETDTAEYARSAPPASDGDWTIDGDNLFRLDGNVGIGRDNPTTKLDIIGNTRVQGELYVTQLDSIESLLNIFNYDVSDWELVAASDADRFDIREYSSSPSLSVEAGGNVGIGTTTPVTKLDVQGTLNVGENDTGYDVNFYGKFDNSRLYWDEDRAALRAGGDEDGTHWAHDSIGVYSLATGYNTKARGGFSTATGYSTTARGEYSTAMGYSTTASGNYSTAMGYFTTARGNLSATAMGHQTTASGNYGATAMGQGTIASGHNGATAMGYQTTASGDHSTAIGTYVTAETTDAIVLGRGISDNVRLVNNIPYSLMVGFSDTTATLFVKDRVGIGTTSPTRKLWVSGDAGGTSDWYNDSDERLKKNIIPIEEALDKVNQLEGVYFEWRDTETHLRGQQMGMIAQKVKEVIPEVVQKKGEYYSMATASLVPLLIEAVKELQAENRELREEVRAIRAEIK